MRNGFGQADRETVSRHADRQNAQASLLADQYERPVGIVPFKAAEGWAPDVAAEIGQEVLALPYQEFSPAVRNVVERAG